jgi:hypothetical protein
MPKNTQTPMTGDTKCLNIESQIKILKEKIEYSTKKLRADRDQNRTYSIFIKMATILLTGIATILLGLQIQQAAEIQKQVAFALASLATLLAALEPFFNYRALWVENELAIWKMHSLQDELEFYLASTNKEHVKSDILNAYMKKYVEIWNTLSQAWIENRRRDL